MLGEQLGESKGKRTVRRVQSIDPLTVEVSFEDSGNMLGVATNGMGTYTSVARPDGSIAGEGQGVMMTPDGEGIGWRQWESASSGRVARLATAGCCTTGRLRRS